MLPNLRYRHRLAEAQHLSTAAVGACSGRLMERPASVAARPDGLTGRHEIRDGCLVPEMSTAVHGDGDEAKGHHAPSVAALGQGGRLTAHTITVRRTADPLAQHPLLIQEWTCTHRSC